MAGSRSKSGCKSGPGRRASPSHGDSDGQGDGDGEMLEKWATHSHHSYHDFSLDEATEIRTVLLDWYRTNRRRLPWRGDPPPYDGSTAGVNAASGSGIGGSQLRNKLKSDLPKNQPSISKFFEAKPTSNPGERGVGLKKEEKKEGEVRGNEAGSSSVGAAAATAFPVTAYGVWVSEIMLQQTRVEAVIPYYLRWMKSFPDVHSLAAATEDEVNSHWAGLGFYRRARLLHAGAKKVVMDYGGVLPNNIEGLLKIDGVGPYTAGAIASIAYGRAVPVVDGNVCRVLSRLTGVANHIKAPALKDGELGWGLARQIVQAGNNAGDAAGGDASRNDAGDINQALMELGATYCAPSGTGTDERDPLRSFYRSTGIGRALTARIRDGSLGSVSDFVAVVEAGRAARGGKSTCRLCDPEGVSTVIFDIAARVGAGGDEVDGDGAAVGHAALPLAPPKKAKREELLAVAAICVQGLADGEPRWLMVKRPKDGLLAGQWEFPSVCLWNSADAAPAAKMGGKTKMVATSTRAIPSNLKKKKKKKAAHVPAIDADARKDALDTFLGAFSSPRGIPIVCDRIGVAEEPMGHIFSHVRHSMWVEYGKVAISDKFVGLPSQLSTSDGREAKFMTEEDMADVGITSAIQKILKAVKAADHESRKTRSTKKRKR